ncbi:MAG: DUF4012 domain-containing protein [Bifidobacterium aquikefiri]|uniref:Chemotaxis protein n=3 Tax=Bifidobacterium aquikefiri TaxID=1653207 RepID=A0A261G2E8_9BIFI|nr:hypothetical protein BAQU_1782 [Bifidobacterium aquikefiri]
MNVPTTQHFPRNGSFSGSTDESTERYSGRRRDRRRRRKKRGHSTLKWILGLSGLGLVLVVLVCGVLFAMSVMRVRGELKDAAALSGTLYEHVMSGEGEEVQADLNSLASHIDNAHRETSGVLWKVAARTPYFRDDITAVRLTVQALSTVSLTSFKPLEQVCEQFSVDDISFSEGTVSLPGLQEASPYLVQAHDGLVQANSIVSMIPTARVNELQSALSQFATLFSTVEHGLAVLSQVSQLAPPMLDLDNQGARNYLVLSQTNAELRARGGMPGSWGVIQVEHGTLTIQPFVSVGELPWLDEPVVPITLNEELLFTDKMGRMGQDMNFTPDFPRAGEIAKAMWEQRFQQKIDGVVAIDPVALQSLIGIVGEVSLSDGTKLTATNTQQTLLHDAYVNKAVSDQDEFFAEVAGRSFEKIMQYSGSVLDLMRAFSDATSGGHVLLWSAYDSEEELLRDTQIAGDLETEAERPQIGVFFSDQTQSKMDWYLKRDVSILNVTQDEDGSKEYKVRIALKNLMKPEEVATTPAYVLGDLPRGLSAGQIDTAILVYAPVYGSIVRTVMSDSSEIDSTTAHEGLHVGLKKVTLDPGESFEMIAYIQSSSTVTAEVELIQTPLTLTADE